MTDTMSTLKSVSYFLFWMTIVTFTLGSAKADTIPATKRQADFFHMKHVQVEFRAKNLARILSVPDVCDGYFYEKLRYELDKRQGEEPVHLYGCGSPEGHQAPPEVIPETLFIDIYHHDFLPHNFKQDVEVPWLVFNMEVYRMTDIAHVQPTGLTFFAIPLTDDQDKKEQDFYFQLDFMIRNIAQALHVGQTHKMPQAELDAIYRKVEQEAKDFVRKFQNQPDKVRHKYAALQRFYKEQSIEMPLEVKNLYDTYFEKQKGD